MNDDGTDNEEAGGAVAMGVGLDEGNRAGGERGRSRV